MCLLVSLPPPAPSAATIAVCLHTCPLNFNSANGRLTHTKHVGGRGMLGSRPPSCKPFSQGSTVPPMGQIYESRDTGCWLHPEARDFSGWMLYSPVPSTLPTKSPSVRNILCFCSEYESESIFYINKEGFFLCERVFLLVVVLGWFWLFGRIIIRSVSQH